MIDKYHFLLFRIVKSYALSFSFGFRARVRAYSSSSSFSFSSFLASSSLRHSQHVSIWNTIMAIMHFKYLFINKWLFTLPIIYTGSYRRANGHFYLYRLHTHVRKQMHAQNHVVFYLIEWMAGHSFFFNARRAHDNSHIIQKEWSTLWNLAEFYRYWYKLSYARCTRFSQFSTGLLYHQIHAHFICDFKWRLFSD